MKWLIEKELKFNGRRVKAFVPNPKTSREEALKRFDELIGILVNRKIKKVSA